MASARALLNRHGICKRRRYASVRQRTGRGEARYLHWKARTMHRGSVVILGRRHHHSGGDMNLRTLVLGLAVVATAGLNSLMAQADSQLDTAIKNPSNWAAQAGD